MIFEVSCIENNIPVCYNDSDERIADMGKITINDIAKKAGVSKSTVSRALNNSGYVSEDARERIMQVAKECSYKPLTTKSGFAKQEQAMIGVVIPSLKSGFFSNIVEGINNLADENECGIAVCSTNDDAEKELRSLKMLHGRNVKGLIITPAAAFQGRTGWDKLQKELDALHIPVVLVDRNEKKTSWDSITFDNFNGAYLLGDLLISEGYKKIGAIVSDTCLQLGADRLSGFWQAMEAGGIEVRPECLYTREKIISKEMAYQYTMEMIEKKTLPEAIFLSNNLIADGFLKAIFAAGLQPGKDIRCVGFDYVDILDILDFEYSYLDREMVKIGRMAMQMLLDRFQQEIESRREFVIPAKIIHRH